MALLADALKQQIETWAADLVQNSRLGELTRSGKLPAAGLAMYLVSLRYHLVHSQANLARAAERSRTLGLSEIAQYFDQKAREERGHERWADNDLRQLPESALGDGLLATHMIELVALQSTLIDRHPICFVAYVLWAEYGTVLIGDVWLAALERSGFARTQVTAVDNHLDNDRLHAAHALRELDRLWNGNPDATTVHTGVTTASRLFTGFCDEIADLVLGGA